MVTTVIYILIGMFYGVALDAVVSGPTLHHLNDTSVVLMYETDTAVPDTVFYGCDSIAPGDRVVSDSAVFRHRVRLAGLLRDTICHYRVGQSCPGGSFITAPTSGQSISFVVFSDYHLDSWYASAFFPRFIEDGAHLAVSNGDITLSRPQETPSQAQFPG